MDFRNPNIGKSVVRRIPHHSIRQTAKEMKALALEGQTSPIVRGFALETLRRVKPKDAISEIGALYYACCREIHYVGDPIFFEFLQHPEVTVNTAAGDCDDMSILLASTLCMSEDALCRLPHAFCSGWLQRRPDQSCVSRSKRRWTLAGTGPRRGTSRSTDAQRCNDKGDFKCL